MAKEKWNVYIKIDRKGWPEIDFDTKYEKLAKFCFDVGCNWMYKWGNGYSRVDMQRIDNDDYEREAVQIRRNIKNTQKIQKNQRK